MWATDITLTTDEITIDDFSPVGSSYLTTATNKTIGGYTWSVYQCMNLGKYSGVTYNNLQMKKSAGTITSPTITSSNGFTVTVTYSSKSALTLQIGSETAQTGSTTSTNAQAGTGATVTATTSSTSTSFTLSAGGEVAYVSSIVITPTSGGGGGGDLTASDLAITGAPVALSFDLYNNSSAQTVSYTTSSTGAVTVSGGTGYVTTSVSGNTITVTPVAVTPSAQTITVSQEADATYAAGSKTFTVTVTDSSPISNIAALTAKSAGNYTISLTDALVTYVNGTNAYLEDASGAVLLYHCAGDLAVGDKITGTADLTLTVYNNLPEVNAFTLQTGYTKTSGNTVTPTEVTIATLESNYTSYLSRYVKIVGATVTSAFSDKNSTIEQSGSSIVLRDQNSSATLTTTVNDIVTVTAHPSIYNSTHQIAVYEQGQIVVAKVNPTITFNNGSVRVGNTLDLSTLFTSNSTGTVTYSITAGGSYASLDGSTLTGVAEGSVTVKAEQAESSSYNAGEATATITVNPALVLSSIAVTTAPTKTTYNEGETFDPTGMVVTATYADNTTEAVTGYTYSPNGALSTSDTEVTISYTESGVTRTTTQAITVNEVVDYATLPFNWAGGASSDLTALTGVTANGLGSDYAVSNHSPYLVKFDTEGDYIQVKTNEQPGVVTIGVKMIGGNKASNIIVQESSDGQTFTEVQTLAISGAQNSTHELETTQAFASTSRYVRLYFNKGANVGVGPISIAKYVAPATYELSWTTDANIDLYVFDANDMNNALTSGDEVLSGTIIYISPDPATGYELDELTVDNGNIALTDAGGGMYSFTMPARDVAISATSKVEAAKVTYTLATSITSGKHYIITNGSNKAMGAQNGNNRSAADVSTVNNVVTVANSDVREFVIYGPDADGYYSIYDETEGGYLYAASSGSNYLKTQETNNDNGRWTISFGNDDQAVITAQGANSHNLMRYNENSKLFSCYTTGQFAIYLNERDGEATPTQAVTVSNASYATFCSTQALDFTSSSIKAYKASVSDENITFTRVLKVPANTGVLLYADGGANESVPALTGAADNVSGNLFVAATTEIASLASESNGINNYILNNGEDGIGFYLANDKKVGAGKAYLAVPKSGGVRSFVALPGGINTGIQTSDNLTIGHSDNCYDLQGRRVSTPKNGLYIINGKKMLVK